MHRDPEVYPEPFKYKPERWIGDIDPRMYRNYVPWAKGSRDCLGKNLAYAELYVILGCMFRPGGPFDRPGLKLECDDSDFNVVNGSEFGVVSRHSKGLCVRFG
ncbi:cytochrome P450 [Apiospora phragmitis]|uniref:Cytochrome P450 n=1 Tax=Apiospora phragmitis TaxID=2905665 RepID=A0ABR1VYX3_9PEZI